MLPTVRAHHARTSHSPRWADRHRRIPAIRSTRSTVTASRTRLVRSFRHGERRTAPFLNTRALRAEWLPRMQDTTLRTEGMAAATAWRSGAYGRPVPKPRRKHPVTHPRMARQYRRLLLRSMFRP